MGGGEVGNASWKGCGGGVVVGCACVCVCVRGGRGFPHQPQNAPQQPHPEGLGKRPLLCVGPAPLSGGFKEWGLRLRKWRQPTNQSICISKREMEHKTVLCFPKPEKVQASKLHFGIPVP